MFLAHAAIPHHHHGDVPCFVSEHCQHNGEEDHPHTGSDHHHSGDNAMCRVFQEVVPSKSDDHRLGEDITNLFALVVAVVPDFEWLSLSPLVASYFEVDTSLHSYHSSFAVAVFGLRAPPFC